MRASHARIAMNRTAWHCAPRVTHSAANAIYRRSSTRPSTTTTNPAAPAPSASTAICRRRPTWWWIAAGSQLPCSAAGPVGVDWHPERVHPVSHQQVNGLGCSRHRWMVSARPADPAHYATALNAGRTGALDAEQQLDRLILDRPAGDCAGQCIVSWPLATRLRKPRSRLPSSIQVRWSDPRCHVRCRPRHR